MFLDETIDYYNAPDSYAEQFEEDDPYHITQFGDVIKISEMSDYHLLNTIRFIMRCRATRLHLPHYLREAEYRQLIK